MPTYEYACKACEHNFEIVQSFSEDTLTTCPACDQDALRKVYNAAGIIFKGDGWHIKDYASPSGGSSSGAPSADASSDGSSKETTGSTDKKDSSGKKGGAGKPKKGGSGSAAARPAAG